MLYLVVELNQYDPTEHGEVFPYWTEAEARQYMKEGDKLYILDIDTLKEIT